MLSFRKYVNILFNIIVSERFGHNSLRLDEECWLLNLLWTNWTNNVSSKRWVVCFGMMLFNKYTLSSDKYIITRTRKFKFKSIYYLQYLLLFICPEWQHRQCVGLVFWRSHVRGSLSAVNLVICSPAYIAVCNTWSSGGTALRRVGDATSQLDLPSRTPLPVAGCGWLQLGAPHWATSVNYCK